MPPSFEQFVALHQAMSANDANAFTQALESLKTQPLQQVLEMLTQPAGQHSLMGWMREKNIALPQVTFQNDNGLDRLQALVWRGLSVVGEPDGAQQWCGFLCALLELLKADPTLSRYLPNTLNDVLCCTMRFDQRNKELVSPQLVSELLQATRASWTAAIVWCPLTRNAVCCLMGKTLQMQASPAQRRLAQAFFCHLHPDKKSADTKRSSARYDRGLISGRIAVLTRLYLEKYPFDLQLNKSLMHFFSDVCKSDLKTQHPLISRPLLALRVAQLARYMLQEPQASAVLKRLASDVLELQNKSLVHFLRTQVPDLAPKSVSDMAQLLTHSLLAEGARMPSVIDEALLFLEIVSQDLQITTLEIEQMRQVLLDLGQIVQDRCGLVQQARAGRVLRALEVAGGATPQPQLTVPVSPASASPRQSPVLHFVASVPAASISPRGGNSAASPRVGATQAPVMSL